MASSIKDFSKLKSLSKKLSEQKQKRQADEAAHLARQRREAAEAELFRRSVGDVVPLAASGKSAPGAAKPLPVPRRLAPGSSPDQPDTLSDNWTDAPDNAD